MPVDLPRLLELATHDPKSLREALHGLDNRERLQFLDKVAAGGASRRIAEVLGRRAPDRRDPLALGDKACVFLAKSSLPALGSFELHMFRSPDGRAWGRTVTAVPTFVGPGYFAVHAKKQVVLDYDTVPGAEVELPKGWPPVVANDAGLAGLAFGGMQLVMQGSGDDMLSGSVWRNGRDLGLFVNLVRSA